MRNVIANLIVDETLDDILLVRPHDHATHVRVIRFRKEIPWVCGVATVFKGYQVVFLITCHVIGMRHAPSGIDLTCAGIYEFRPCLMNYVPVLTKLFPLQLARVCRWWP